jgi:hypothetical protein
VTTGLESIPFLERTGPIGNLFWFKFAGIDWYLVYKILNNPFKDENAMWKVFSRMNLVA